MKIANSIPDPLAALNRSFARHPPEKLDPFLQRLALEGMKRTEWKE
jgi:hypothetical protein